MSQTVYLIYEKSADALNAPGHQTRVYLDRLAAEDHVAENNDPMVDRWMVIKESAEGEPPSE